MTLRTPDTVLAASVVASTDVPPETGPREPVPSPATSQVAHRRIEANGISIHIAEAGDGPLVLLIHGVPELWYSWRYQLESLAAAGYHVVAADLRGCGRTAAPAGVESYSMLNLVSDVVGLLDAAGEETAVLVGHDWGAHVAYHCAELYPSRVSALVALSAPYSPRGPEPPSVRIERFSRGAFSMVRYFQEPGLAEAEMEADPHRTFRLFLYGLSGDAPAGLVEHLYVGKPPGASLLDDIPEPSLPMSWLTAADVHYYATEFGRTGFTGALNRYRNLDRDWEELGASNGAIIEQPALFVGGSRDGAVLFGALEQMRTALPNLRGIEILPGSGHWVQQEKARQVNEMITGFLTTEAPAGRVGLHQPHTSTKHTRKETDQVIDSIQAFLDQWSAAEQAGDPQRLDALLTDDFAGIGPLGFTLPKPAWLDRHRSRDLRYDSFSLGEVQTRVYGPTAVVTARNNTGGRYQGHPIPEATRATLVLVNDNDDAGWRLAAAHMSFIAGTPGAPPLPAAANRPQVQPSGRKR
jgi:pimeloyl-ACP methyl ester carboxylesterase/ketosteroid isomerase-like protein